MRLLIVENDPLIQFALSLLLQSSPHEVVGIHATAAGALDEAGRTRIDLAIIDIRLKDHVEDADGIAVARELRRTHGVPALFFSGDRRSAEAAMDAAIGLLLKPVRPQQLLGALDAVDRLLAGLPDGEPIDGFTLFPDWDPSRHRRPDECFILAAPGDAMAALPGDGDPASGLHQLLEHARRTAQGALWTASTLDLAALASLDGHINVLERHESGDYRFLVFAGCLADHVGVDMGRQLLGGGPNRGWAQSCHDHLSSVGRSGLAEYRRSVIFGRRGPRLHHRLVVPVSSDGLTIDRWLVGVYPAPSR